MSTPVDLSTAAKAVQALDEQRTLVNAEIRTILRDLLIVQNKLSAAVDHRDRIDQQTKDILLAAYEDNCYKPDLNGKS